MSRYERYGTRDLTYSQWHRTLGDSITMIDIDGLEYCRRCRQPLQLIETAKDVGQGFKATLVMARLAERAHVPASLVFWRTDGTGCIDQFRKQQVYPERGVMETLSPEDYAEWLGLLRNEHECPNA